jgi:hypothetical protein
MFAKQPHDKAERKTFFFTTSKDMPATDKKLMQDIEKILNSFGGSFADKVNVEKFRGPQMQKTDEYVAVRPGSN